MKDSVKVLLYKPKYDDRGKISYEDPIKTEVILVQTEADILVLDDDDYPAPGSFLPIICLIMQEPDIPLQSIVRFKGIPIYLIRSEPLSDSLEDGTKCHFVPFPDDIAKK